MRLFFVLMVVGGLSTVVQAHPGHGVISADSPVHYVAEPQHAVWGLAALGIGLLLWGLIRLRKALANPRLRLPPGESGD